MSAYDSQRAHAFGYLEARLDAMLRVAEGAYGARWPLWFEERLPIEFFARAPDAVWLVSINWDLRRRWWQFDVERVSTAADALSLRFREIVDEEKVAKVAAAGVGRHLFRNALRKCLEALAGPSRYDERLCVGGAELHWLDCQRSANRPIGVAIEASRPVPGSDLHEVHVQLPSAAPPPEPPAAGEPKSINFREFF